MKARLEKKLSKRLVQIAPLVFKGAWMDTEGLNESEIKNILCVGGEPDYWGEQTTIYTVWNYWSYYWLDYFIDPSSSHKFKESLDSANKTKTDVRTLLSLAIEANQHD